MTEVQKIAALARRTRFESISEAALLQLKIRILDSLGVAIAALPAQTIGAIREHIEEFGGNPISTLIGGGASSPDHAVFYNASMVRYLDYMDSYLAPGETFHPSDNLAAVLAASEYANASGKEFLAALALAYEVQARLSESAPVRRKGFDHTVQLAYSSAAGATKALGLDPERTAHALAISGVSNIALRATRTGEISHWKGLAAPNTTAQAIQAAFLARRGITGPLGVIEGNKGLIESITGEFRVDWESGDLDAVTRSIVKKYDAEIHSQSAIEAALEIRARHAIRPETIERIRVETFEVAYQIIGGGEEGAKNRVRTKEQADHSFPYVIAAALIDGELFPAQYAPERIQRADVQSLLRKISVRPDPEFSRRFPSEVPARVSIFLDSGKEFTIEKNEYEGFHTRPFSWERAIRKFDQLTSALLDSQGRRALVEAVGSLPDLRVRELTRLLSELTTRRIAA